MDGFRRRNKNQLPALEPEPLTPIHILTIHEKPFIEEADLRQGLPAHHPETAGKHIDLPETILWPMVKQKTAEPTASWKEGVQSQRPTEHIPDTGKSPTRTLQFTVSSNNPWANHADCRVLLTKFNQPGDAIRHHFNIRINQA